MRRTALVLLALWVGCAWASAAAEEVPVESDRWTWRAREKRIEEHLGRQSVYLKGGIGWIQDVEIADGAIDFDISFTGERGFVGAIWRIVDGQNYEEFYVRPHQTGKVDATQYTPIFNGAAGWQLYHGPGFGEAVTFRFDEWIHVRIVFAGQHGEVYIDDMEKPAVTIHELKRKSHAGPLGIMAGNFAPAWFSNFSYEPADASALKGKFATPAPMDAGTVASWLVSNAFAEKRIADKTQLTPAEKEDLTWSGLQSEPNGTANLARIQGIDSGNQTTFARIILHADAPRVVRFQFGYSDRVRVYLDDRLLYAGNNGYRTRDFRYLGTIGLFDELALPLQAGNNELWLAVSEDFGGWGVVGKLENANGVTVRHEP